MVSEINGPPPGASPAIEHSAVNIKPAAPTNAPAPANKPSGESVTLTDLSSRVSELTKSVENIPVSDPAKVASFRDSIESGNYQVNAEEVAEKFNAIEQILSAPSGKK
jgi:flagellar biosynthesis anti-sigma factor FlgM